MLHTGVMLGHLLAKSLAYASQTHTIFIITPWASVLIINWTVLPCSPMAHVLLTISSRLPCISSIFCQGLVSSVGFTGEVLGFPCGSPIGTTRVHWFLGHHTFFANVSHLLAQAEDGQGLWIPLMCAMFILDHPTCPSKGCGVENLVSCRSTLNKQYCF